MEALEGDFSTREVERVVGEHVSRLSIYNPNQRVEASLVTSDPLIFWACYEATPFLEPEVGSGFHLNIGGGVCYLLSIGLQRNLRGRGIGREMYKTVEAIARDLGCLKVRQMPSGFTSSGESRRDYLKRKLGYTELDGGGEVEKLLG